MGAYSASEIFVCRLRQSIRLTHLDTHSQVIALGNLNTIKLRQTFSSTPQ